MLARIAAGSKQDKRQRPREDHTRSTSESKGVNLSEPFASLPNLIRDKNIYTGKENSMQSCCILVHQSHSFILSRLLLQVFLEPWDKPLLQPIIIHTSVQRLPSVMLPCYYPASVEAVCICWVVARLAQHLHRKRSFRTPHCWCNNATRRISFNVCPVLP